MGKFHPLLVETDGCQWFVVIIAKCCGYDSSGDTLINPLCYININVCYGACEVG